MPLSDSNDIYENLLKDAKLLAKHNWQLLNKLTEFQVEQKWLKFGLWEYDEKAKNYKTIVWSDMLVDIGDKIEGRKHDNENQIEPEQEFSN